MPIKRIVSVSGGAPSAWAAIWAYSSYPKEEIELVFADTRAEDPDNYRFLSDLESFFGIKITRLIDGRTPLEVGEDENYIPTQAFATCTFRLKTDLIMAHTSKLQAEGYTIEMLIGYDLTDMKRVASTVANWAALGIQARFPIIESNCLNPHQEVEDWGIRIPRTYAMGFKHANCIAQGGCVKFGKKDTIKMIEQLPENHLIKETWEEKMIWRRDLQRMITWQIWLKVCPNLFFKRPLVKRYTFLRDATGDYPDGISLKEFRLQYESKKNASKKEKDLFMLEADLSGCTTECGVNALEGLNV